MGEPRGAELLQLPQGFDLWRIERDPAEHHREIRSRLLEAPMDFDLTDEQQLLKDSVDRLIADRYGDFERRKTYGQCAGGWSRAVWQDFASLGLTALPFDESVGGIGGGPVETMIVMEAIGRGLALEPFLSTVVLGGAALRLGANKMLTEAIAPQIA